MSTGIRANRQSMVVAVGAACVLATLGTAVLVGWLSRMPALVQVLPHLPPMTRNAAVCFVLCSVAMLALALQGPRWVSVVSAGLVLLVGGLTLTEIYLGLSTGVNEILGSSYITVQLRSPGRMSPTTAFCFSVASLALLATATKTKGHVMMLAVAGAVVAALGMAATTGIWVSPALAALHTAAGLFVLGFGLLALASKYGSMTAKSPPWLAVTVAVGLTAATLGLWQALVVGGHSRFSLLPLIVLAGGLVMTPLFALTVHLAQRGHAQTSALRRSEAFLEQGQRLSRTGSFSWKIASDELTCSAQIHRILGADPLQPLGVNLIRTRIHPEDVHLVEDIVRFARSGPGTYEFEPRLVMPDGSIKHVQVVAHGTRRKDGALDYTGAVQDVTERRASEDALAQVRSELAHMARVTTLGALTASITHEVNQPLSGIITNANTCLRMLAADPPNVYGAMETVRRSIRDANRASQVIARLRSLFVKTEASNELLELNEGAREVIALTSPEFQRSRVRLRTALSEDLPKVLGDRIQLQQVVLNLLLNAIEAMDGVLDRPREVLIATYADDEGNARLSVTDSGIGLGENEEHRLFEPFYTTKRTGMGIGLFVSRTIVEGHQGRLWAQANNGPGATVSFSIPPAPVAVRLAGHHPTPR